MKTKIHIVSITLVLCFSSMHLAAQDDNDYTNNRGKKKQNQEAINTKKKTPVKIIQYIVGTWEVEEIHKGNKDITDTDTVGLHQTIEFNREGRYVSHSGTEKIDSGAYRLNENHSILYLESEIGSEPQEWDVAFNKNGDMTLRPRGTYPHAESFKYIYSRTSTGNQSPN
jgi:hypothetical protein